MHASLKAAIGPQKRGPTGVSDPSVPAQQPLVGQITQRMPAQWTYPQDDPSRRCTITSACRAIADESRRYLGRLDCGTVERVYATVSPVAVRRMAWCGAGSRFPADGCPSGGDRAAGGDGQVERSALIHFRSSARRPVRAHQAPCRAQVLVGSKAHEFRDGSSIQTNSVVACDDAGIPAAEEGHEPIRSRHLRGCPHGDGSFVPDDLRQGQRPRVAREIEQVTIGESHVRQAHRPTDHSDVERVQHLLRPRRIDALDEGVQPGRGITRLQGGTALPALPASAARTSGTRLASNRGRVRRSEPRGQAAATRIEPRGPTRSRRR